MNDAKDQSAEPPDDVGQLNYAAFLLAGTATWLPYMSVTVATRVFEARLGSAFFAHYSAVFLTTKFVFLVGAMTALRTGRISESASRYSYYALSGVMFLLMALVVFGLPHAPERLLYVAFLGHSLLVALVSAMAEAGIYGLAGCFPGRIIQALFIGHGLAGILATAVSTLLQLTSLREDLFAILYFSITLVLVVVGTVTFHKASSSAYFQHHKAGLQDSLKAELSLEHQQRLSLRETCWRIADLIAAVFIAGLASLVLHPFLLTHIHSAHASPKHPSSSPSLFRPAAFLLQAVFDLLGKLMPIWKPFYCPRFPFLPAALSRALVVLTIGLGNFRLHRRSLSYEPLYQNDVVYFLLLAGSATLNSYTGTLASMVAPLRVPLGLRSRVSSLMVFFGFYGAIWGVFVSVCLHLILHQVSSPDHAHLTMSG